MMEYVLFIGKGVVTSGFLYGYYHFFLRDHPFHRYNRLFLLIASVAAVVLPFLRIHVAVTDTAGQAPLIKTLQVITAGGWGEPAASGSGSSNGQGWLNGTNAGWLLYLAGIVVGMTLFIRSLIYIIRVRQRYTYDHLRDFPGYGKPMRGVRLYHTAEPGAPFSFFKHIFWHQQISIDTREGQQILRHELFHVKEKHSADIIWMEMLCISGWFNPFFHLMKRELKAIHEFLADEHAAGGNDSRLDYAELLLTHRIEQKKAGFTSAIFHHPLKRRITMITSFNKARYGYLSRVMALPLLFLLFCAFAFRAGRQPASGLHRADHPITVVVDAGHGGQDQGSRGANGLVEKSVALQLAQRISELGMEYNIRVVLTRNMDILPGNGASIQQGLENRVKITKDAGATAFISIHVNNDNHVPSARSGFDAYISNRRTDKGGEQLASAILKRLTGIYTTYDQIEKREREGIYVLDHNECPAILLECGYINNPTDVQFVTDPANQEKIARTILQGIADYQHAGS